MARSAIWPIVFRDDMAIRPRRFRLTYPPPYATISPRSENDRKPGGSPNPPEPGKQEPTNAYHDNRR